MAGSGCVWGSRWVERVVSEGEQRSRLFIHVGVEATADTCVLGFAYAEPRWCEDPKAHIPQLDPSVDPSSC